MGNNQKNFAFQNCFFSRKSISRIGLIFSVLFAIVPLHIKIELTLTLMELPISIFWEQEEAEMKKRILYLHV